MTRRFDIGPIVLGVGSILTLVALFLTWYGDQTAWDTFELTDVLLAALAVAGIVAAVGLLVPDVEYLDRRVVPWVVGATLVLVTAQLLNPPPAAGGQELSTGAWLAFAGAIAMVVGAVLSLGRVSFAVSVEGRDRRRRVAAVDHRPPPTETGAPVARSSASLLHPRTEDSEGS
ncbi:MAG TPA: hypothetical protein VIN04_02000 [Myxococcota bacterium]